MAGLAGAERRAAKHNFSYRVCVLDFISVSALLLTVTSVRSPSRAARNYRDLDIVVSIMIVRSDADRRHRWQPRAACARVERLRIVRSSVGFGLAARL